MSKKVKDFVNKLHNEAEFFEAFRSDPIKTICNYNMTTEEALEIVAEYPKNSKSDFYIGLKILKYIADHPN